MDLSPLCMSENHVFKLTFIVYNHKLFNAHSHNLLPIIFREELSDEFLF
jgi:hypothetical protein